jgi:hypothetical protein
MVSKLGRSMLQSLQILAARFGEAIGFPAILLLGCIHDFVYFISQLWLGNIMSFSEIDPDASHLHAFLESLGRVHAIATTKRFKRDRRDVDHGVVLLLHGCSIEYRLLG